MPPLQVKDCPTDVYEALKLCAASENRSMSQQTLTILEEYLGLRPSGANHTGSGDHTPGGSYCSFSFAKEGNLSRRERVLKEMEQFPCFDLPDGFSTSAELVRASREERW